MMGGQAVRFAGYAAETFRVGRADGRQEGKVVRFRESPASPRYPAKRHCSFVSHPGEASSKNSSVQFIPSFYIRSLYSLRFFSSSLFSW